jgi:hypothetical protein
MSFLHSMYWILKGDFKFNETKHSIAIKGERSAGFTPSQNQYCSERLIQVSLLHSVSGQPETMPPHKLKKSS